jgi:2-succinyl-5-enolpyruvyl-6-hydroxy-3-cyclohexene-1-carboxylate synthase
VAESSTTTARAIVDELVRAEVRHAVLSPGSRSAPLALALFDADAAGRLTLHVRIDERSAAFVGLGIAKTSACPVPVVTTSGTAVANLHPAMLEAHHAGVPLVALTADRPAAMRGTGANQTTNQVGIFSDAPRLFADLPAAAGLATTRTTISRALTAARGAVSANPGPVHVNVQFAEPLVPGADDVEAVTAPGRELIMANRPDFDHQTGPLRHDQLEGVAGVVRPKVDLPLGPRTVVVAGDDAGRQARLLAESAGWPLLAEPTSGARTGDIAMRAYRLLLDGPLGAEVERVVMFGHPTLSRPVNGLLTRADVELVVVSPKSVWPNPEHRAALVASAATVPGKDDAAWLIRWAEADIDMSKALDALIDAEPGLTPHEVAGAVSHAVPAQGLLVVGSSNPVRDLDLMAVPYDVGGHRKIIANRGLSGIDGFVSTAVGAALGRTSSRSIALMGDVTFLHDANGLIIGPGEPRPDLTIVVLNDNGGRIFATLEQGDPKYQKSFERVFTTPHHADLAALCAASGTSHRLVADRDALAQALTESPAGVEVLEVPVDGSRRRSLDHRIRSLAPR